MPAVDFICTSFRTVLDFSSAGAATPVEDGIRYGVNINRNATV